MDVVQVALRNFPFIPQAMRSFHCQRNKILFVNWGAWVMTELGLQDLAIVFFDEIQQSYLLAVYAY